MRNLWLKIGCFITGWNFIVLSSCTESSRKQLKKYTSAILILIIIWALTGYLFAERYVNTPWWGSAIVAIVFSIIIVQIERVVILTVGKNPFATGFRVCLAIIMAILGSTILDQIIFKDDIEKKMVEIVDRQVIAQLPNRLTTINSKLKDLQIEIDSLDNRNMVLYQEISARPTINTPSTSTTYLKIQQPDGIIKTMPQVTITNNPIVNPKAKEADINENHLVNLRKLQDDYNQKKLSAEQSLRNMLSSKSGFLEELSAILEILTEKKIALCFYLLLFSFLMFLELLVVSSKVGDTKSDYDLVIEHQLNQKRRSLLELSE